jgi:hypothetical protein
MQKQILRSRMTMCGGNGWGGDDKGDGTTGAATMAGDGNRGWVVVAVVCYAGLSE